jgi:GntR family transcriptional regulator/MocR family aminotransferase
MWLRLEGEGPTYRRLHRALRDKITAGDLVPGTRLPATRALAADLGVSRTTVLQAYDQLLAEGFIVGRAGSGSYVSDDVPAPTRPTRLASGRSTEKPRLSRFAERLSAKKSRPIFSSYVSEEPNVAYDFRYGRPSIADFPVRAWHRAIGRRARAASVRAHDYGHPRGSPALRAALADYLLRARGVRVDADHLLVVTGSQQGLDLAARVLLEASDVAVVEEPGYEGARRAFDATGARLVFVPADECGLRTDELATMAPQARLAHVTPSHHYPLGGILPYPRRVTLLSWARATGSYLVEDDYDGEYRYGGPPLEALQALDRDDRVIYLGTFSKVMYPALRLGYLALPDALVEPFTRAKLVADGGGPTLEQDALADFIVGGDFERHIRRSRKRYAERRALLLDQLEKRLSGRVQICGAEAGLHVVVRLLDDRAGSSREIAHRAREAGVGIYPLDPYYEQPTKRPAFVVGYGGVRAADIRTGVARLAAVLEKKGRN